MDEGKRILISFLRVTGIILIGFPIYVYFINPTGFFAILPLVLATMTIGTLLVVISTVIWRRNKEKNGDINPERSIL